jgi:spore germination protein KB
MTGDITNKKISVRQFQSLVIVQSLGTALVLIPRFAFGSVVTIVFSGFMNVFYTFLISRLGGSGIFSTAEKHGNLYARLIVLLFAVKISVETGIILSYFSDCTQKIILNEMNTEIISVFMILCALYGVYKGIEVIGRCGEMLLPFVLIPVIFIYAMGIKNCEISNIVFDDFNLTNGLGLSFCFGGAQLALICGGYTRGGRRGSVSGVLLSVIITVAVSIITIAFFGKKYFNSLDYGVLEMMYSAEKIGFFIHRQEALVMCFWIVSVFFSLMLNIFFICEFLKKGLNIKKSTAVITAFIAIYAVSFICKNEFALFTLEKYTGLFFILLLPSILLLGDGKK